MTTNPLPPFASTERTGILLGLLAMTCFSAGDGIWKHCLGHVSMAVVFCINFSVSAIGLIIYARRAKISFHPRSPSYVAIFILFYVLEMLTFGYALGHMPIAELFVIVLTTPLFVLISARLLLQEKLSPSQTASIVAGFAGTIIVVLSRSTTNAVTTHSFSYNIAIFAALSNVVIGGSKILFMRRYGRDENAFCLSLGVALAFVAGGVFFAGSTLNHVSMNILVWLCLSGTLSTASTIAYVKALQKARASLMSATQYSQIIWATLMGALLFNEPLSVSVIVGIILIMVSGFFLYSKELRHHPLP
jgi:drug/metabolite transporter (DMT)-like permease